MPNYTSRSPILRNYAIVNCDGVTIVRDLDDIDNYYIPLENYAKMAGLAIEKAEAKARQELSDGGVLYIGEDLEGIKSRYLVPVKSVFRWLMVDNWVKAVKIGGEAIANGIIAIYEEGAKTTTISND